MALRVAAVAVVVSLLALGLEAPALAAPTITSFTPTSGPVNCVVVITGIDFADPVVTSVTFGGVAADFAVKSDSEIWAAAPAGGNGPIVVTKAATGETASSAPAAFTVTTPPDLGRCAPTVTSFNPTCGTVGTTVAIEGTNLITHPAAGQFVGGQVEFSPFDATGNGQIATHPGQVESPTSLSVNVPATAQTGRIQVTTQVGDVFTTDAFTVVTDFAECVDGIPTHPRRISLRLRRHLVARGTVVSTEDPAVTECVAGVPVKIQRRKKDGGWRNVGSTTTNDTGKYRRRINDRPGVYRAKARTVGLGDALCVPDRSPRVRHRH